MGVWEYGNGSLAVWQSGSVEVVLAVGTQLQELVQELKHVGWT